MEKKKKGFTLVELLATLAIMGVIVTIGVYSYSSYKDKSEDKLELIEAAQIEVAANSYLKELEIDSNYKSYTDENGITYSCISIKKLQESGFYKGDLDLQNKSYDDAVVKVTKKNGVVSFEVLTKYFADSHCIFDEYSGGSASPAFNLPTVVKGGDVNLKTEIKDTGVKNEYDVKMTLDAKVIEIIEGETTETNNQSYIDVVMLLDGSGSMSSTDFTNAFNEVKTMSATLYDDFVNSRNALVQFSTGANIANALEHKKLVTKPTQVNGTTNMLAAFLLAKDIFDNNKPTDASGNEVTDVTRYVVFLTDGIPEAPYNYTVDSRCNRYRNPIPEECKTALKEKSQLLKDQGVVVIVIGYGISNPVFSEMASSNTKNASGYDLCPILTDSSGNKYGENTCYYTSGKTSGLSDIFKAITKTIKYSVANKTITKAEIVGTFSNDIIMKDLDGNVVTSINRTIEVEDNRVSSDQTISEVAEYKLSLKNVNFPCDYDRRECSKTIPILDSYKLVLYNGDEVVKSVDLDSSYIPKVTITKELKDYIN